LQKKVVFLVSRGKNEISSLLAPSRKIFLAIYGKIHYFPPGKNPYDAHGLRLIAGGEKLISTCI